MNVNGMKIEVLLAKAGITKTELANRCGVSRQNISTIVKRGTCEPRTLGKLAAGLCASVSELTEGARPC